MTFSADQEPKDDCGCLCTILGMTIFVVLCAIIVPWIAAVGVYFCNNIPGWYENYLHWVFHSVPIT